MLLALLLGWLGCERIEQTHIPSGDAPNTRSLPSSGQFPADSGLASTGAARDALRETLRASIDSLRQINAYEEALTLARAREKALQRAGVPEWQTEDARCEVSTLRRIASASQPDRAAYARADRNTTVAESLLAAGALPGARELIEAQLEVRRRVLDRHDPEIGASLHALARICITEGNVWRAFELDKEALAVRRHSLGPKHPRIAESLDALGMDYKGIGDPEEAMRICREALAMQRELLGPGSTEELATLVSIAHIFRLTRQPDSALVVFDQVLDQHRRTVPRDDKSIGRVLFGMAMTLIPDRRWSEAEPLLREAVATQRAIGPSERVAFARSLASLGTALRHLGRTAEAESVLTEAAHWWEELRASAAPGPIRSIVYSMSCYSMLAAAQLDNGHEEAAWKSAERPLARSLIEDLVGRGAIDTTGWWHEPLSRVQNAIGPDEAIIGWLALRPGASREEYPFWCYCIRSSGPVRWMRVDRKDGDPPASDIALVRSGYEMKLAANWPLRVSDLTEIRTLGEAAYVSKFEPFEPWLEGARHLIVLAPDLNQCSPMVAWVDREGRWLADRFEVTYAPSALLYAELANSPVRLRPAKWQALLVAGQGTAHEGTESDHRPGAPIGGAFAMGDEIQDIAALVPAPTVFAGENATADVLRDLGVSGALARFELIHFASHATADQFWLGRSALLLAPADSAPGKETAPDRTPMEKKTHLDMQDIVGQWKLDAELVTLAACRSGIGVASTNDGYLGLPYALLGAGTRNVIASLWPIDDGATSLLMKRFYQNLMAENASKDPLVTPGAGAQNRRIASALNDASVWVREWRAEDGSTPYEHPIYWAGFILHCGGAAPDADSVPAVQAADLSNRLADR